MTSVESDPQATLADFVADADLAAIPAPVRTAAIRQIADTVAVGWAGSDADGVAQAAAVGPEDDHLRGGVPLWGRGTHATPAAAAFVNGVAAAALDYDLVHQGSLLHPAAITVPIAMALGAARGISGARVIDAHIVGSETMCRISMATPRQSNWFPASVYGIFGAAACAARLMDLDAARTRHALGLALAQAAGTKQAIAERTLAKRFQTAFAIRGGLLAAELAASGVTAAARFLDGAAGLFALYESGEPDKVVAGLGEVFVFDDAVVKKFPSCLCTHVVIEACQRLRAEDGVTADAVTGTTVTITPYMNRLIGGAYAPGDDPQVAAQFSAAYAAACALRTGGMTLGDIDPAVATDPGIVRAAQAVDVRIYDDRDGHVAPGTVQVGLADGGTRECTVADVPNAAAGADAERVLRAKGRDCLLRGLRPLDPAAAETLLERLFDLEHCADMSALFAGLVDEANEGDGK